jgi:HIP---CoA ligase
MQRGYPQPRGGEGDAKRDEVGAPPACGGESANQMWETIPEMVLSTADRFGNAEAIVDGPLRLTFREVVDRIRCAAGAFADLGVGKGERVAIWAPNSAEWIIAAFGLLTAGGVLVPVNTRFKPDEAGDVIARSTAKAVLVQKGFLGQDYTTPVGVPVIDLNSDFLAGGSPFEQPVRGTDIADIIFTSGTTGRPKGAMMNHRQTLRMYEEWATLADLREGDRYLQINPYFHTFGLKAGLISSFLRGATMLPLAVFDVDSVVDLIEHERITMLPGPPTLYHSLLTVADKAKLSTLRAGVTGAADIPVDLVRRIHDELPFQTLMTGYGLTEAGNVTLSRPGDSFEDVATTAGLPCEEVQVRIADDGEVLVRGYGVMAGYLDDPAATAEAIDDDGWLHTGDLGNLDAAGRLKINGRKKDMFIVGGFNAYPAEIEGFMLEHPAVVQVAVIGVPDERLGQVGKAFVVPTQNAGGAASEEDLIAWCRQRMAGFKVPRYVEFLLELPLNATGKVMKDQLR